MDAFTILDNLQIRKTINLVRSGVCESCQRAQQITNSNKCKTCHGLTATTEKPLRFRGAFYADQNGMRTWTNAAKFTFDGSSVTPYYGEDWLAQSFYFIHKHKVNLPYVFVLNVERGTISAGTISLNIDSDLIRISGPIPPVTKYRDSAVIRRSDITAQLSRNINERRTPAERFVSIMCNRGLNGEQYAVSKDLKKWTM